MPIKFKISSNSRQNSKPLDFVFVKTMYMNYDSYYYEPETEPQEEDEFDGIVLEDCSVSNKSTTCSQGHTSTLIIQTNEGGSICLVCFSNLISNPNSPTLHVSYALSQLSQALSSKPPHFLQSLITFHPLFLISPLVQALSSFDDFPIASQLLDLISLFCSNSSDNHSHVLAEFVSRVSGYLSTGALAWSRRQVYMVMSLAIWIIACFRWLIRRTRSFFIERLHFLFAYRGYERI